MARTKAELSAGARLSDFLTVGFLAMQCPVDTVRHALQKNGAQSKRRRGLPHEVLVYFVMMMVLYGNVAYEDVMRLVVEGLRTLLGDTALERSVVTKGAISQARSSVGEAPLRQLYEEQVCPHDCGSRILWLRVLAKRDAYRFQVVVSSQKKPIPASVKGTA